MLVINITKLSLVECSFFLFFSILVTNKYSINKKKNYVISTHKFKGNKLSLKL